jgi:hypothetical protein
MSHSKTIVSSIRFCNLAEKETLKVFFLVLFIVFSKSALSQDDNRSFHLIRARLVNSRTGTPVVFARVIDKNLRAGVLSDSLGVFSLTARLNDTLYVRSISFYPAMVVVSDSLYWQLRIPEIPLQEQVYELGAVDIYGWGTYQEFKYKVLHGDVPVDKTKTAMDNLKRALRTLPEHPLQEQASIPLGSPVTALYMLFSKEGKSIRRYEAAKERDHIFLLTYQKFNRDIVGRVTGLTGNLLDEFMMYCRPDDNFLLEANDYDIHRKILEDYDRFKTEVLSKDKNSNLQKPSVITK